MRKPVLLAAAIAMVAAPAVSFAKDKDAAKPAADKAGAKAEMKEVLKEQPDFALAQLDLNALMK